MGYLGFYNSELGQNPFERYFVGGDGIAQFQLDGRETVGLREIFCWRRWNCTISVRW